MTRATSSAAVAAARLRAKIARQEGREVPKDIAELAQAEIGPIGTRNSASQRAETARGNESEETPLESQRQVEMMERERLRVEHRLEELRDFEREYRTRLKVYLESQLRDVPSEPGDGTDEAARHRREQNPTQRETETYVRLRRYLETQLRELENESTPDKQSDDPYEDLPRLTPFESR